MIEMPFVQRELRTNQKEKRDENDSIVGKAMVLNSADSPMRRFKPNPRSYTERDRSPPP